MLFRAFPCAIISQKVISYLYKFTVFFLVFVVFLKCATHDKIGNVPIEAQRYIILMYDLPVMCRCPPTKFHSIIHNPFMKQRTICFTIAS